jgi:catechol 2,3-dioxygenase-like lactoylglutathione lyase family enzyme
MQHLALISLVVADYDEAIHFYVDAVGFDLIEDSAVDGKRWVVVRPLGSECSILLAQADGERQQAAVGDQAGGRVWLFLHTDDFARDHARMSANGVRFTEQPRHEPYGIVAVWEDLYGNRWDLLEPSDS